MSDPICVCGHTLTWHYEKSYICHYCECKCFTDSRIAALEARLARRDAAFAALVGALKAHDENDTLLEGWKSFSVRDRELQEQRREALELVEGVEI